MVNTKRFQAVLHKIKTSPNEQFGVIYHGEEGVRSCIGFGFMASGDHRSIKGISITAIMQEAQRLNAKGMTLVHSHPRSLMPRPSEADLHTTFTIHDATKKEGVPVLDHLIFGSGNAVFSFTKNGIEI